MGTPESFPRQSARTRQYQLGAPRTFTVASDGARVLFLRSTAGDDPANALWALEVATGAERLLADPRVLLGGSHDDVPSAERARRERVREVGGGIVAYDADPACTAAVVALGGRLFLVDVTGDGGARALESAESAYDPRLAPTADAVAYVLGGDLRVVGREGDDDRQLVGSDDPDVSWGSADWLAAEEMGRTRGHWWAPDGRRLAVARVDVGPVQRWHLADPADPAAAPLTLRYPAAGTANACVGLAVVGLDGASVPVRWDDDGFPYLVDVRWAEEGLVVVVQTRDQRTLDVLEVDPATGTTTCLLRQDDPAWVDIVGGVPAWLGRRLVTTVNAGGCRRLALDGELVSPPGLHVRRVVHGDAGAVLLTASEDDPTIVDVYLVGAGGVVERLTGGGGVHHAAGGGGGVVVISSQSPDWDGARVEVRRGTDVVATVSSHAEVPVVRPQVAFSVVGDRRLRAAVMVPSSANGTPDGPLPVLMDPYAGPQHQRVMRARSPFLTSQWFADQGFAVVVVDGRGTPGRGPAWEREVRGDLAGPVLDDQVDALHALAAGDDRLDLGRVAIRGWSFGGHVAAQAVLRRPDVFHAAVAGAPVTDWALYDTHYSERYLGRPDEAPDAYRRSSIIDDANQLVRPLLLIHGLADDNVVAAHTFRLSRALLEAGRVHRVLPLSGVTHMTPQEVVAENLLRFQVDFLQEALGVARTPPEPAVER